MVGIWGGSVFLGWCLPDVMVRPDSPRVVVSSLARLLIRPAADSLVINGVPVAHISEDEPCSLIAPGKGST